MARSGSCSICGISPAVGRGWCRKHYSRWHRTGDPHVARPRGSGPRDRAHNWRGDAVSYEGAHIRLRKQRGPASKHPCRHCDQPAAEWAYDYRDRDPQVREYRGRVMVYSLDPNRYMPLCCKCHRQFDAVRKAVA